METKTNDSSSTTSDSASTINMASLYDCLKQFYEKVSDDPGGKNLTFLCKLCPPGFKKQLHTSTTSTANLKWHIELKHPASLSRYVPVNKKSKGMATVNQNRSSTTQITLTAYSSGSAVFISQPESWTTWFLNILSEICSFSVEIDQIIAVCGSIRAVAIILKIISHSNILKKKMNYEL